MTGWEKALADGREMARRFQIRTVVAAFQWEAAQKLRELGWTVQPPEGYADQESEGTLRKW